MFLFCVLWTSEEFLVFPITNLPSTPYALHPTPVSTVRYQKASMAMKIVGEWVSSSTVSHTCACAHASTQARARTRRVSRHGTVVGERVSLWNLWCIYVWGRGGSVWCNFQFIYYTDVNFALFWSLVFYSGRAELKDAWVRCGWWCWLINLLLQWAKSGSDKVFLGS